MIIEGGDLRLVLNALDKKVWSLDQSGLSGAYAVRPVYAELRERVAREVQKEKDAEVGRRTI